MSFLIKIHKVRVIFFNYKYYIAIVLYAYNKKECEFKVGKLIVDINKKMQLLKKS
jgi:hypothetical protein